MIRRLHKFDRNEIVRLLHEYKLAGNYSRANEETVDKILAVIFAGGGVIFGDVRDNVLTGMIMAIKTPMLWDMSTYAMNEICLWVSEEHRNTSIAFRLIKQYCDYCDKIKDKGEIYVYTISQTNKTSLKYDRFGFTRAEETWTQ